MSRQTVADVMTRDVVTVEPETPFKDVVHLLADRGISAVPVVGATAKIVGVVSEADLLVKEKFRSVLRLPGAFALPKRWRSYRKATARTAADVMTTKVKTIGADTSLAMASRELLDGGLRRLYVVDEAGKLQGVLARRDVLRVFTKTDEELAALVRRDVVRSALWATSDEVSVHVNGGEVTLDGELDRRSDVDWATRLTDGIPGVVAVHNQLRFRYDDIAAAKS